MPVGTINLNYITRNFHIKKDFDTRVNVKDTIEQLRFSTVFNDEAVGVAFLNSPKTNASRNILIKDASDQIRNNSRETKQELKIAADSFLLDFASFYLADVVGSDGTPFYYWHDLGRAGEIRNIEVLDSDMQPVPASEWLFVDESERLGEDKRGIYTNLQCSLDERKNSFEVFFVRYLDEDSNIVVKDLLDSKPYYSQSSFLSERSQREYVISATSAGYQVDVVFDSMNYSPTPVTGEQRFFVQARHKGKVYVERPAATSISKRWNLRISPGDFNLNGKRYWVPEYYTQQYSPTIPYKLEKERKLTVLDRTTLHADLNPIANLKIEAFFLYISIRNANGELVRAITNDPDADTYVTKNGFITDIFYEKDVIESVAEDSGFIKLKERLEPGETAYLTYRYIENYLTYRELSVNPSISQDILGKRVVVYVLPDEGTRSVHHLIVDNKGLILDSSEDDRFKSYSGQATGGSSTSIVDALLPSEDAVKGFEVEILSGGNSGIKIKVLSSVDGTLSLEEELPYPVEAGNFYRILKKVEDYTTYDEKLGREFEYQGWEGLAKSSYALKLADVYVIQSLDIRDISSHDARVLGGGIKDERVDAAIQLQDEVRWYWDLGNYDGTPYPGMGALLVELPRYILKEMGGTFERPQIEEIVRRHLADGSYPVIKYYDISTEITEIVPGNGKVFLRWNEINASEYNVYIGNSPDNVFRHSSQPGTRVTAEIEGLDNNKIYYVQIEPIVGGQARLRSRTIGFMPYSFSTTLPPIKYGEGKFSGGVYE